MAICCPDHTTPPCQNTPKAFPGKKRTCRGRRRRLFSVIGMTCAACAGSVEKAVKRLPGIREAAVDVLNNRAQVLFYPSFVNEETIREAIEDADDEGNVINEEEIDSRLIQKNDVKIIPGAKVASDGFVLWGQSHVNESMITGEARPVAKTKGDPVIGGTVNENGVLHIKATKVGSESALSQIVRLVESAQMAKAPVQKFADRISRFFVPLVIILSFTTWLAWFLAGKFHGYPESWIPNSMDSFELALQFGISVMVNCIVFDKTGTLTVGKPVVVNTKLFKNMVLRDFYELVAAAEVNSEHPLAKAIVEYAKKFREDEENPVWPEAQDFVSITGHGVKAIVATGK
ncbi:hypothetical protein GH714_003230 [Hevea brasiliensis]|uniref:HMA domain-containing protein n=1 Tax=Hevea brasiliensis TaxID=3981 RepID=A0A6A6LBF8_HEVBR|nr:hypothetical protein GH714_003230 [Hevea brasiliensis]